MKNIKTYEFFRHTLLDASGSMNSGRFHDMMEDKKSVIFEIDSDGKATGEMMMITSEEWMELNDKPPYLIIKGEYLKRDRKEIEDRLELIRAANKYNL